LKILVKRKKETRALHGISGYVEAGQMMAVMGSSGAGKTTALDIMARKTKSGKSSGLVLINGQEVSKKSFVRLSGYVDQEDCLLSSLTVRETVLYAARLRLPSTLPFDEKVRRVQAVLVALRIDHVADKLIGSRGARGISGGEKRRVSIACELVTTPAILFLDEPTSGLDAFSAFAVVDAMKTLATRSKMVVVMTIHQPRSNIFSLFDKLLLLTKGKVFYSGPLQESGAHFASIGFPCPPAYNPADYFIDIASTTDQDTDEDDSRDEESSNRMELEEKGKATTALSVEQRQAFLVEKFKTSPQYQALKQALQETSKKASEIQERPHKPVGIFEQMYILSGRAFINFYRNPLLMYAHYGVAIVLAIFMGGLFWKVENNLAGFQNSLGFVFFSLAIFGFGSLSSIETFDAERQVFVAERSNGYYNPISYFISKVLFDNIPLRIGPPIFFTCISYFMIGFSNTAAQFFQFMLALVLFNMTAGNFVILFGSLFRNKGLANLLASLTMLFSLLFSGFLINKNDIPPVLGWVQYLSFFNYPFEAMTVNELDGKIIQDEAAGLTIDVNADVILTEFGFNINNYWPDIEILAGFYLFYLLLSFLALQFLIKEKK